MINTVSIKGLGRLKVLSEYLDLDRTKKKKMLLTYYGFPVYCFLLIEELKIVKIYSLSLLVYI